MESSKYDKTKRPLTVEEVDLADRDKDVFDPVLSYDLVRITSISHATF
jgi:hypothetical protein